MDIDIQLKNIQTKLQQLLKQYQVLQRENVQLKKELDKSKLIEEQQNTQLQSLQQQTDALRLGVTNWSPQEKEILEKRIEVYLKEIDKCLELLHA